MWGSASTLILHADSRRRDLLLHGAGAAEDAIGLAVPVLRVVEVAFQRVDDAVQPGGQRRLVLLHDLVRLLPVAGGQQLERAAERVAAAYHVAASAGAGAGAGASAARSACGSVAMAGRAPSRTSSRPSRVATSSRPPASQSAHCTSSSGVIPSPSTTSYATS